MAITQQNRQLAIATALGADVLAVRTMSVQEQLSRLFEIETDLFSEDAEIDFDKVVGNNATIRLDVGQKETRFFNGYVSRFVQVANQGGYARYRATLVPWLWFLTRSADCRIFQDKTIPEVIEAVFKAQGLNDYQINLSAAYQKWEYCVQYRETDFNFVSRLMEQEGIYYFFQHEDGKHTLVLADSISAHNPFAGYEEVTFYELEKGAPGREVITDWVTEKEVQPVAYALNDFDFTKPKTSLLSSASVTKQHGAAGFEIYDYLGEYDTGGEGDRLAQARLDELQSQFETLRGQASARGLVTGCTFKLKNHPRADQNREYLITGVSLQADAGEYASAGAGPGRGEFFSCNFTDLDKAQQFRAARVTPKPIVQGLQTAIVVGPSGEEIYTDKYGRVKVLFPWDRYAKADENSSCWIRVVQAWAGKKWGAIYTPRIGQEVIVEFLEGDPDQPIITGRVYNAEAMPPYDLPGKATISTTKSNSSKGGSGFNEIRFEDKKGDEQIFVHGEKNLDIRVKNDRFETIENDRHLVVKKDKFEHIENNRDETVDADHQEQIGKDRHLNVVGKEAKQVGGSLSLTVNGDVIEVFKANHSEQTTNDYYLKADNIVIEGMTSITVKVGGSSIAIASDGIALKTDQLVKIESGTTTDLKSGTAMTLDAGTALEAKGGATAEVKSPATTVKADGNLTVKGGMVMIN
jgi:type VI secretion system secreted protein VgrG